MGQTMVPGFRHNPGMNCESSALRDLLLFKGLQISEPMVFGLGEGLNFIYWDMKVMDFPFTGGRTKPDMVFRTFCDNLGIPTAENKTRSRAKGWAHLKATLDEGEPVLLKLDAFYLDYFDIDINFPAHYVSVAGYDDDYVYLGDTAHETLQKTRLESLADARASQAGMGMGRPDHLCVRLRLPDAGGDVPAFSERDVPALIRKVARDAIGRNAAAMLNPPIKNAGVKGLHFASKMIPKWLDRMACPERCLKVTADIWEHGGTGGGLFRKMYAQFLSEAGSLLEDSNITRAGEAYAAIGDEWTTVAGIIDRASVTLDPALLLEAGARVGALATRETEALSLLV